MSAASKLPFHLTREDFLAWCPDDGQRWQLIDGEPVAMAPARFGHNALLIELGALLRNHLAERGSPCVAIATPGVVPHVRAGVNFRVPDLGVTCTPVPTDSVFVPAPVLLVEILSPGNERDSWANVWAYTTIPSVREILVLHTKEIRAELLRRQPDGNWPANTLQVTEGEFALDSIGFAAPVAALYRTAGISGTG
ncbi:Uma2 family endonuclease [Roseomonas sp. AR75]|jgi:Uma2 family endonuclease|uniref:Uma2 family endonuclease n=1 Tax=Roseomonas sp. AR75 TaxID=2562311 RepID=UPI0010BFABE0|nr:Uma2 family endonuclease [Roseomonas sp. AR75]